MIISKLSLSQEQLVADLLELLPDVYYDDALDFFQENISLMDTLTQLEDVCRNKTKPLIDDFFQWDGDEEACVQFDLQKWQLKDEMKDSLSQFVKGRLPPMIKKLPHHADRVFFVVDFMLLFYFIHIRVVPKDLRKLQK